MGIANVHVKDTISKQTEMNALQGAKASIPTVMGYTSVGIAAGLVGVASNLSPLEITLLATFMYGGASQFIIYGLIVAATPLSMIIFTTFIVNLRHFLLCLSLAPHFKEFSLKKNILIGAFITDETFGVASNKRARGFQISPSWMYGLNFSAYTTWVLACLTGSLLAKWISNPEALGLDFALTAMFVALLILQLQSVTTSKLKHHLSLVIYMIIAMLLLMTIMPSHLALVVATVVVATIGVVTDK
ncbi:azaleucine resistance protein AzlC [Alkalihalobacillus alcalophilus ATCC 27647 = CGMCC 1.3604]|uniref:Azaleucine resistance protein AzlC n=1 Tax=Alkalihalobacillus alcalophilus ATCC 27647 = CGMCC 1.3604 TaxID=1218173 RepID=J8TDM5_ALKAL|nr:branched-chain amino acid efflux transporter [Alkalihalobacillus alcalophilus ATCC 27647 = CGMCC 1.3604]THG91875.1 azaleucine resistance protein AzlC [Alkalihalobacillus alcalophilus ATCC 27647 = CGMCC 1.3604]